MSKPKRKLAKGLHGLWFANEAKYRVHQRMIDTATFELALTGTQGERAFNFTVNGITTTFYYRYNLALKRHGELWHTDFINFITECLQEVGAYDHQCQI